MGQRELGGGLPFEPSSTLRDRQGDKTEADPKQEAVAEKDKFCIGQVGSDVPMGHQGTSRNPRLSSLEESRPGIEI